MFVNHMKKGCARGTGGCGHYALPAKFQPHKGHGLMTALSAIHTSVPGSSRLDGGNPSFVFYLCPVWPRTSFCWAEWGRFCVEHGLRGCGYGGGRGGGADFIKAKL